MSRTITLDSHGNMIDEEEFVKHAHWVRVFVDYDLPSGDDGFTDILAMCSECGHADGKFNFSYVRSMFPYCPHCAAVMDGEVE